MSATRTGATKSIFGWEWRSETDVETSRSGVIAVASD